MTHGTIEVAELRVMSDDGLDYKSINFDNINNEVYTVATLPLATAGAGIRAFVSDATVNTFASAVIGGGAESVPVYSDGTVWRIG